ncbi:MAG: YkgJ family cysteine cluster protein [Pirellula sp.]
MNSNSNDGEKAEIDDRDPWYAKGLSFECTQCGNCCSGPGTGFVWVSEAEISAIAARIGIDDDIDGFERKFTRRIGARVSLVEYSDGDCIFLDPKSRNCSVYEARPVQCRTWPFWDSNVVTPKAWGAAAKSCPGCNHGKLYSLVEIQKTLRTDKLGAENSN